LGVSEARSFPLRLCRQAQNCPKYAAPDGNAKRAQIRNLA
jgi:hypothetical protein